MGEGITKRDAKVVQGIAILLMVCHHMFLAPEIYEGQLHYASIEAVRRIAWFGKSCVAMFAFVSGYGMFYVLERRRLSVVGKLAQERETKGEQRSGTFWQDMRLDALSVLTQLWHFYQKYWVIFGLWLMAELGFGQRTFKPLELLWNILGISSSYQSTWWYVGQYDKMLLFLLPMAACLRTYAGRDRKKQIAFLSSLVVFAGGVLTVGFFFVPAWRQGILWFFGALRPSYTMAFVVGYVLARWNLWQRVEGWFCGREKLACCVAILEVCSMVALRVVLATYPAYARWDFVIVPIFLHGVLRLVNSIPLLRGLLAWFGGQSTYIWLIHGYLIERLGEVLLRGISGALVYYLCILGMASFLAYLLGWFHKTFRFVGKNS